MKRGQIDPGTVAFDVDGVVADTMTLFLDIARDEYRMNHLRYEDITCYELEECLEIDPEVLKEIVAKLLAGEYAAPLKPIDGAGEALTRIGRAGGSLVFVTARPSPGLIRDWLKNLIDLDPEAISIIATGTFEAKKEVLLEQGISVFVEDRLETCFHLSQADITPVVFRQPWNRQAHPFLEVGSWEELSALILGHDGTPFDFGTGKGSR